MGYADNQLLSGIEHCQSVSFYVTSANGRSLLGS